MRTVDAGATFQTFLATLDQASLARVHYCYQLGSTFIYLNRMEHSIIDAMATCDHIQVEKVLGVDTKKWERFVHKLSTLQDSTLGSLIKILSHHLNDQSDLQYLRWLKDKRDFFIHRLFRQDDWPGELDPFECNAIIRRLRYLEILFDRASGRIWKIFERAGLVLIDDLDAAGQLIINPDLFEHWDEDTAGQSK